MVHLNRFFQVVDDTVWSRVVTSYGSGTGGWMLHLLNYFGMMMASEYDEPRAHTLSKA